MPWSFSSLLNLVEQGQYQRYDDMERDEVEPQFRERELRTSQHLARTRSRSRPAASVRARSRSHPLKSQKAEQEEKKILKDERRQADPEPKGQGQSAEVERRHQQQKRPVSSAPLQHDTKVPRSHDFQPSELESHPPFQRARERASATISSSSQKAIDLVNLCDEVFSLKASPEFNLEESGGLVFQLEVAMPDNKKDLKRFTRDSETWVSRKMKKGVDLKWAHSKRPHRGLYCCQGQRSVKLGARKRHSLDKRQNSTTSCNANAVGVHHQAGWFCEGPIGHHRIRRS